MGEEVNTAWALKLGRRGAPLGTTAPKSALIDQEITMNTFSTSTNLRRMTVSATFCALAASFGAVCSAADINGAPQAIVKYGDLNVSSPQGAAVLYARILTAADRVCEPLDNRDLGSKARMAACVHKAIADAVTQVNQPALFGVYNAKNKLPQPIILAAGPTR
jgi:UrcA family protein